MGGVGAAALGQTLSLGSRSGNRHPGSSVIVVIGRAPKSSVAWNVRLPANHTSTGQVTSAVVASTIFALAIGLIAGPEAANCTLSTTGDGI